MGKSNKKKVKIEQQIKDEELKNQSSLLLTVIGCMAVLIVAVITTVSLNMKGSYAGPIVDDTGMTGGGSSPSSGSSGGGTTSSGSGSSGSGSSASTSSGSSGSGSSGSGSSPSSGSSGGGTSSGTTSSGSSGGGGSQYPCAGSQGQPCGNGGHLNADCTCTGQSTGGGTSSSPSSGSTSSGTTSSGSTSSGGGSQYPCAGSQGQPCGNGGHLNADCTCTGQTSSGGTSSSPSSGSTSSGTTSSGGTSSSPSSGTTSSGGGTSSSPSSGSTCSSSSAYWAGQADSCAGRGGTWSWTSCSCSGGSTSTSTSTSTCWSKSQAEIYGKGCAASGNVAEVFDRGNGCYSYRCVTGPSSTGSCSETSAYWTSQKDACAAAGGTWAWSTCSCKSSEEKTCEEAGGSWEFGKCWPDDSASCEKINYACTLKAAASCDYGWTGCTTCNAAGFICKNKDGSNMTACETVNKTCANNADSYCGVGNWSGCSNCSLIGYSCNATLGCTYGAASVEHVGDKCVSTFTVNTTASNISAAYCCTRAGASYSGGKCSKECSCNEKECINGKTASVCTTYAVEQCGVGNYTGCSSPDSDGCFSYKCKSGGDTNKCYKCTTSSGPAYVSTVSSASAEAITGGSNCSTVSDSYCVSGTPTGGTDPTPTPDTDKCYYCKVDNKTGIYTIATSASKALEAAKKVNPDVKSCAVDSTNSLQRCEGGPVAPPTSTGGSNCYRCKASNVYIYTTAKSASEAATITKGTDCGIVDKSMCNVTPTSTSTPVVNPPTGGTAIIIAWILGIFAIVYSVWYFSKNSELEKK